MSEFPTNRHIDPGDWTALVKAAEEMRATQEMLDLFIERANARIEGSNRMARAIWRRINDTNPGLDLENVNYVPHDTLIGVLVPVSMKLSTK